MADSRRFFIETARPDRSPDLARVKPRYGEADVAQRFRRLAEDGDGEWLLLLDGEEILGWCVAAWSGKATHPEYPDMMDLYVRPEHRGQGHGTRLIREIEARARSRGHHRIGLAVNPELNADARRLYERLGYRHDGRESYVDGVYDGVEDRVIDLERDL